jgi:ubiquinone/menaquinone biosynthesis C-methylase UbiE
MLKSAIIRYLMRLRSSRIQHNFENGATFREFFNHPVFLGLPLSEQREMSLNWARKLYDIECQFDSLDNFFGSAQLDKLILPGANILDIGCYVGGKTIRWLEKFDGKEIFGIDIDPQYIAAANELARERNLQAHFKVNYAENLDFDDEYFDLIITENTFEHVQNLNRVMAECHRVLRKGGLLVVIFPSFWGPTSHHLDLVTRTPFLHWIFKYPELMKAYNEILDERGSDADWYRRKENVLLPYEKGYTVNGTTALQFRRMLRKDWNILIDGYMERPRHRSLIKNAILAGVRLIPFSICREVLPIAYVLQKSD